MSSSGKRGKLRRIKVTAVYSIIHLGPTTIKGTSISIVPTTVDAYSLSHLSSGRPNPLDQPLDLLLFSLPHLSRQTFINFHPSLHCLFSTPPLPPCYCFSIPTAFPSTFLSLLSTLFRFTPSTAFRLPPAFLPRLDQYSHHSP